MFLKRIETVGFKSFADRTTIEFVEGITAVVGPNGSGKSNIIDAVRWVLGEQSARSLRGQKMEDIIFQGSDSRPALNFAEVTLILNNETKALPIEYHEVSITRRVYRSGDSEFYVNKQACRLKDIVDLFMDTGLGRESFSIIGQGKIDEILSSKADERRAIFEEAAGVLKYKQRKQKAEVKLEETAQNLARVEDIMHEMKGQIEPLKEQAEKAKHYKGKKEKLREVEVSLLVTEINILHEQWQKLLQEMESDKDKEIKEKKTIQQREAVLVTVREELESLESKLDQLQKSQLQKTEEVEQLEGKKSVLQERVKHVAENKSKLEEEKQVQLEQLHKKREKLQEEQGKMDEIQASILDLAEQIKQLKTSNMYSMTEKKEEMEQVKADYIEALNKQAALRNEENSINFQLKQIDNRMMTQESSSQQYIDQRKENKRLEEKMKGSMKEEEQKLAENEEQTAKIREENEQLEAEYAHMQERLFEGNEQIAKVASRKEMLEEMKNNFQGYFYGVKEILQAAKQKQVEAVDGVVIDLMDVPTKYMTAIDTLLGAQAQHIVVRSDGIARNIIQWLKKESKGRATFLPLSSIEKRGIPKSVLEKVLGEQGYIGLASELVEVDEPYKLVVDHLMGNAIVTEDLKSATTIASKTNRRYRIVTLDGDIVYPGGSMSGGAKKQQNLSLFTREKELNSLKEKLRQYRARRSSFQEEMAKLQERLKGQIKHLREREEQQRQLHETYGVLQRDWNELKVKIAQTEDQLVSYELYMKQYMDEKELLITKQAKTNKALDYATDSIHHMEEKIARLTEEVKLLEQEEKTTEERVHTLEKNEIEWKERSNHMLERRLETESEILQIKQTIDEIDRSLSEMDQLEQLSTHREDMEEKVDVLKNELAQIAESIERCRENRRNKHEWLQDEEQEIRGLKYVHAKTNEQVQQLEVQTNRLDVTLENRLQFLQSEYVMTYEYAASHFDLVEDMEAAEQVVDEIKESIKALGTINLGAIEEYDRITERYEFLQEQQVDLLVAKDTLYTVIKEMDKEMTERFETVFQQIQEAFTDVFKQLFGGGRAALTLTDPDDLLETGIDIVAQPPGKKLQSLELLSGGERSLTAIALLFAILRTRLVPFVILDEVDAALDEANVIRFSHYLKSYRDETQFIVITHRNGTMEEADVLYGVTMRESGVSKLVSVKLEEAMN